VFDVIVNPKSRYRDGLRGPVAMWMHSPPLAEHMFAASTYLRYRTQFDQRLTELAILVTARELDSQYEWTAHEPAAAAAGLEPAVIDVVKHRGGTAGLGKAEAIIIQFGRELVGKHALSSATFADALAMFGRQGVTNLAALMAYYTFNSTIIQAFDVRLRPDQKPLLPGVE
jgi:4-carboxymuconolactone decarboxylase